MNYYRLNHNFKLREENFGGLIFNRNTWQILQLNPMAFKILKFFSNHTRSAIDVINMIKQNYDGVESDQQNSIEQFLAKAENNGFIIKNDPPVDEKTCHVSDFKLSQTFDFNTPYVKHLSAPLSVWWDITELCNLKCKQCYSSSGSILPNELSTEEAISLLKNLAEMGIFYIYILGGEPFLRKDFFEILKFCQDSSIDVMISTNGWYIDREVAGNLKQLGVGHVRVSLDGAKPETHDSIRGVKNSFCRAINALHYLKAAGIPKVGISPTIMNDNFHEAEEIILIAKNLALDEIQLVQVCSVGRGRNVANLSTEQTLELRSLLARKIEEIGENLFISSAEGIWEKPFLKCVMEGKIYPSIMGCGAGRTCLAIGSNGKVRACLLHHNYVGDVRTASFSNIWSGLDHPEIQKLRKTKDGCEGCKYEPVCSGPCPMQHLITPEERKQFVHSISQ